MRSYRHPRGRPRAAANTGAPVRRQDGFSLVELIVTLVVLSILAAFAVPQITAVINASRITGNANELLTGLQLARMEAVRANARTSFCHSTNGTTCSATTDAWTGWLVFIDRDFDGDIDGDEIVRRGNIEAPIQVLNSSNLTGSRVDFRSDGLAYRNGTTALLSGNLRICMPTETPEQNARDLNIASGGRSSVGPAIDRNGACVAPGN